MRTLAATPLVLAFATLLTSSAPRSHYAIVDVDGIGFNRLESLRHGTGVLGSIELGETMLVFGDDRMDSLLSNGYTHLDFEGVARPSDLRIFQLAHASDFTVSDGRVVARRGRFVVVQNDSGREASIAADVPTRALPFDGPNMTLLRSIENDDSTRESTLPEVDPTAVNAIDSARWFRDVETLATYNRYTKGTGIIQARDWMRAQLETLPNLQTRLDEYMVGTSTKAWNIIATIPGSSDPNKWIIVGGHYDATSESPSTVTPGAEDNASGAAGVLEMARAFSANPPAYSMAFVLWSGEEQGLLGSKDYVARLLKTTTKSQIRAVITMDMIGFSTDTTYDVTLETGSPGQPTLQAYKDAAARFTTMKTFVSMNPFGSDHMPFLNQSLPAVLTIDNDWDSYKHYHKTTDLPKNLSIGMGEGILRMNVGMALLTMAANG